MKVHKARRKNANINLLNHKYCRPRLLQFRKCIDLMIIYEGIKFFSIIIHKVNGVVRASCSAERLETM